MRTPILCCCFLFINYLSLLAYPITPRPLRILIQEADFIAIAHMDSIVEMTSEEGIIRPIGATAHLTIQKLLKGDLNNSTIEIPFIIGMICPTPPHYIADTTMLVFFDSVDNGFRTHALSYGAKNLSVEGLQIYEQRIFEFLALQKEADGTIPSTKVLDWLIKCLENPATKWEGVYDLGPRSGFRYDYNFENEEFVLKVKLKNKHITGIQELLITSKQWDYFDPDLLDLVIDKGKNKELTAAISRQILKIDPEEDWMLKLLILAYPKVSEHKELNQIAFKMKAIRYDDPEKEEKEAVCREEFLALLKQVD